MTENERRKFLKASLASLAGAAGVSLPGCEKKPEGETLPCYYGLDDDIRYYPPPREKDNAAPEPTADDKAARREELTKKLEKLAEEPVPPEIEVISADCYMVEFIDDDPDFFE